MNEELKVFIITISISIVLVSLWMPLYIIDIKSKCTIKNSMDVNYNDFCNDFGKAHLILIFGIGGTLLLALIISLFIVSFTSKKRMEEEILEER